MIELTPKDVEWIQRTIDSSEERHPVEEHHMLLSLKRLTAERDMWRILTLLCVGVILLIVVCSILWGR